MAWSRRSRSSGPTPKPAQMNAAVEAELHDALRGVPSLHAKIAQPRPGPLAPGLRPGRGA